MLGKENYDGNTPIEKLIADEYDDMHFMNEKEMINMGRRYVRSMPDCQVRAILHLVTEQLAKKQNRGE